MTTTVTTDTFIPRALSAAVAVLDAYTSGKPLKGQMTDDLLAGALALEWLARRGMSNGDAAEAAECLRRIVCNPATAEQVEASHLAEIVRDVLSRS
jgi:hypothetical protein